MSMFTLERLTPPGIEVVTLSQMIEHVKEFTSISQASQDRLTGLITGAREWAEDFTGRALVDQTWRLTLTESAFPSAFPFGITDTNTVTPIYSGPWAPGAGGIYLRRSPVLALVSVATVDSAGAETAVDVAGYEVLGAAAKYPRLSALTGATWSGGTLRIVFRAGFADRTGSPTQGAEMVPEVLKQAMKLWAEAMYDRDEKMMPLLLQAAENIARPQRCELSIA